MDQSTQNDSFPIWAGVLAVSALLIAAMIFAVIDSGRQYLPEVVKKQAINRQVDSVLSKLQ